MAEDVIQKETVRVEFDNGVAWVYMSRPAKKNAMSPQLNRDMLEVVDMLEFDDRCGVLVLTGDGDSFAAGMDLKEYFKENDGKGRSATLKTRRTAYDWQWHRLMFYEKPTIAMVNGWCFGGAFSPLVGCDLAIAADEAQFGLSEINWGIIPGGNVTKVLVELMSARDAMYYTLTGETFDGKRAAELKVVNEAVPADQLRARVRQIADSMLEKNPHTLKAAKDAIKRVAEMTVDASEDYLVVRQEALNYLDKSEGRKQGLKQFIDDKTYRPGLGAYKKS